MEESNSEFAIRYMLKNEGGFVNDPKDHGGATNFGITQATYSTYLGRPARVEDVQKMKIEDAIAIYKKGYWRPAYDKLDRGVATAIFDWGVLHGPKSSQILAQQIANSLGAKLVVDGDIGPLSIAALNAIKPATFLKAYVVAIKGWFSNRVIDDPSQKRFLKGWNARADRMLGLA
jgi:type VI secretion system secreted protein VgrG